MLIRYLIFFYIRVSKDCNFAFLENQFLIVKNFLRIIASTNVILHHNSNSTMKYFLSESNKNKQQQ